MMKASLGLVATMLLLGFVGFAAAVEGLASTSAAAQSAADLQAGQKVQASFDQRIDLALKLKAQGVTASLVESFVSFAQDQKAKVQTAANASTREELVVEFNAKWREFKQAADAELQSKRKNIKELREELQEKLSERKGKSEEKIKETREAVREKIREVREKEREKIQELTKQRHEALLKLRAKIGELEKRLMVLRTKAVLSAEENAEFRVKVLEHLQASFDQRIAAAKRLELEGVNASLVSEFVTFAEAQKTKFANATNNTIRKELIVEFNVKWREFKQGAQVELHLIRVKTAVEKSHSSLAKLNEVIARLNARGANVRMLQDASAKISVRLDAAASASTFAEAMAHLKAANHGLVYLKTGIRKALNRQKVEAFVERLDLKIEKVLNTSVISVGQLGMSADGGSAGILVSVGSPSTSPAASPTPENSASGSANADTSASSSASATAGASTSVDVGANISGSAGVSVGIGR